MLIIEIAVWQKVGKKVEMLRPQAQCVTIKVNNL